MHPHPDAPSIDLAPRRPALERQYVGRIPIEDTASLEHGCGMSLASIGVSALFGIVLVLYLLGGAW